MAYKACFIGLGNMGAPMASNLLKNGVELYVYNRTQDRAKKLLAAGAQWLESPRDAFEKADIAFTMVADDRALEDVVAGEKGLLAKARPGCIHVSMSTIAPKTSQELAAKHREKGVHYLAAPVFGRPDVAEAKNLWICIAGPKEAKQKVEPLFHFIGQKTYDFGDEPSAANAVKLSGNFLILSVVELLSEAFSFVEKSGISLEQYHSFLTDSLFPSPVFKTYGHQVIAQKYAPAGFKMHLGLKDIDLLLRTADKLHVPLPVAGILHDRLMAGLAHNRGEMDWSAIALTEREESGIPQ